MGYQTDFVGYLHVTPELNDSEIDLVNGISGSIYLDRRQRGLCVMDERTAATNDLGSDAPSAWSNWTVCATGCCLSYDGATRPTTWSLG